jgi:hypothetical protein
MVSDLPIQCLRRRVLGEAQHVAAPKAGQAPGPARAMRREPEGAQAAEHVGIRPLAGPWLRLRQGVQLEAPDQVVGKDAELLPGAVGRVVLRRHDVERVLPAMPTTRRRTPTKIDLQKTTLSYATMASP